MAKKRNARALTVTAASQLTQNMRRVTLQGEELAGFPEDAEGGYFKLTFPSTDPERPVLRTYTVSQYRPELNEIDVDFMLHTNSDGSTSGFAASWAIQARPGDKMGIFGPGPASFINTDADWYFLAADMTALPALVVNLATLPRDAKGYVAIEIIADEDKQALSMPEAMELVWVVNPHSGSDESPLYQAIKELQWLPGQAAVWAACEFKTMKRCRQYFRDTQKIERSHLYISSYWKKGLDEEEHKIVKKEDS